MSVYTEKWLRGTVIFLILTLNSQLGAAPLAHQAPRALRTAATRNSFAQGTSAAQFLKIAPDARAAGMGGAVTALADDACATLWNPAGLAFIDRAQATASHSAWPGFYQYHHASWARNQGAWSLGLAASLVEYDTLLKVNNQGQITGSFGASDQSIVAAIAKTVNENFSLGFSAKSVRQRLDEENAWALAGDAGLLWNLENWQAALAASNWGTPLRLANESAPLPANARLALARRFDASPSDDERSGAIAIESWIHQDSALAWRTGIEHWVALDTPAAETLWMAFRAGYHSETAVSGQSLSGLTTGFGIWYKAIGMDFSFEPSETLGNVYQLGIRWKPQ